MKRIAVILVLLALVVPTMAQHRSRHHEPRFDYTVTAGVSFNQIDGDDAGSYNKFGIHASVGTTFSLTEDTESPWRMLVEVGVMQKGSRVPQIDRVIGLTYVELPLALTYKMSSFRIGAGVAPAFLAQANVTDGGVHSQVTEDNFRKIDRFPVFLDVQYRGGDHWGINVRAYNSMLSVVDEAATGTYRIFRSNMGVFNRNVTVGVSYRF